MNHAIDFSQPVQSSIFIFDSNPTGRRLVASTAGLGDDALELVDLRLGAAEGTELEDAC